MAISVTWTSTRDQSSLDPRVYLENNISVGTLGALYPDSIKTNEDLAAVIDNLITDFQNFMVPDWQITTFSGCLSFEHRVSVPDGNGRLVGDKTWVFENINAYNAMLANYNIELDWRLYELSGTNLVNKADGTVKIAALDPKNYLKWLWYINSQTITVKGQPVEI